MALKNTFADASREYSKKQVKVVDAVTQDSPIIKSMPVMPASHVLKNVYEEVTDVTTGDTIDLDGVIPTAGVSTGLKETNLTKIAGIINIGEDKAKLFGNGDPDSGKFVYFEKQLPIIGRATAAAVEQSLIYNNFLAKIIASGKAVSAGGSANTNYSMFCIRWGEGENIGLIDGSPLDPENFFDLKFFNDAKSHLIDVTIGGVAKKIPGYSGMFAKYLGLQLAQKNNYSAIVNIDPANSKIPTIKQIGDMLVDADAGENTAIYMSPFLKNAVLNAYKFEKVRLYDETELSTMVDSFDGIPIVTSRNFKKATEGNVSL